MGDFVPYLIIAILALGALCLLWMDLCIGYVSDIIRPENRDGIVNRLFFKLFVRKNLKMEALLHEVMLKSTRSGFPSTAISIYRISRFIPTDFYGQIYMRDMRAEIFMSNINIRELSDEKVRAIVAHEAGHYIEFKTYRTGHPVFRRVRKFRFNSEEFAWFMAMYLYPDTLDFYPELREQYPKLKNLEITSSLIFRSVE